MRLFLTAPALVRVITVLCAAAQEPGARVAQMSGDVTQAVHTLAWASP